MLSGLAARLLTGPAAFLLAGLIDLFLYAAYSAARAARRRVSASTITPR